MIKILLVEDLSADALLFREALRDAGLGPGLTVAHDGREALAKLRAGPLPDLVLLDLDLPRISGREVLGELRSDPRMQLLPVVVVTTSPSPDDIDFAYRHHANAYVRKPNGFVALSGVAEAIRDFWVRTATLPARAPV
jgi:CheY-like chemotaxis protein